MILPHTVEVRRRAQTGTVDELLRPLWGGYATVATLGAFVQPRTSREVSQLNQSGVTVGAWWALTVVGDVRGGDQLRWRDVDYEVRAVSSFDDGRGVPHHLEIDLDLVKVLQA